MGGCRRIWCVCLWLIMIAQGLLSVSNILSLRTSKVGVSWSQWWDEETCSSAFKVSWYQRFLKCFKNTTQERHEETISRRKPSCWSVSWGLSQGLSAQSWAFSITLLRDIFPKSSELTFQLTTEVVVPVGTEHSWELGPAAFSLAKPHAQPGDYQWVGLASLCWNTFFNWYLISR